MARALKRERRSATVEVSVIVEYTRYKIDQNRRALFERAYDKAGAALPLPPHCERYELSHCTEDPISPRYESNGIPKKDT